MTQNLITVQPPKLSHTHTSVATLKHPFQLAWNIAVVLLSCFCHVRKGDVKHFVSSLMFLSQKNLCAILSQKMGCSDLLSASIQIERDAKAKQQTERYSTAVLCVWQISNNDCSASAPTKADCIPTTVSGGPQKPVSFIWSKTEQTTKNESLTPGHGGFLNTIFFFK